MGANSVINCFKIKYGGPGCLQVGHVTPDLGLPSSSPALCVLRILKNKILKKYN